MSIPIPESNDIEWQQDRLRDLSNFIDLLEDSDGVVGQEATTLLERAKELVEALREYSGY